ncbi:hypothetical protein Taro_007778 [Colocasia esculenta]|uniref:Smr domain-containing protein n=1 Tax=Colocasia esculenta TaxID=4460 RepID=A0A843U000_COLES|nr:hypothetical protein [Colocasia esculenta]
MTVAAAFLASAAPPLRHPHPPLSSSVATSSGGGVGRKHAERLFFSLDSAAGDERRDAAADRVVRKFLASSSNATALHTLSYLLSSSTTSSSSCTSPADHLALPLYRRVAGAPWFRWNSKLNAGVVPLLEKLGRPAEAEALVSEAASSLKPRKLAAFYGELVESYARHGSEEKVFEIQSHLRALHLGKGAYGSLIRALCLLGLPEEAEGMVEEMGNAGLRPSPFEYRLVAQSYGRLGSLSEMRRVLDAMVASRYEVDTVCANMVISCYGDCGELPEMVEWLRKTRASGVPFSIRTYNSVLNSCPGLCSMLWTPEDVPLSLDELMQHLEEGCRAPVEALLVQELVGSEVLAQTLQWSAKEGKLDLHGCHLGSALVVVLQWVDELKGRLKGESAPVEISIVCGLGKHSSVVGASPVKKLVCEMMFRMESPLRIDRKNAGRLVARGTAVRDWLGSGRSIGARQSSFVVGSIVKHYTHPDLHNFASALEVFD